MYVKLIRKGALIKYRLTQVTKALLLSILVAVQGAATEIANGSSQRVAQSLETDAETTLFVRALKTSDLWKFIEEVESVTLFVPKNKALLHEGSDFLLDVVLLKDENSQRLNELMALHIVPGRIDFEGNQSKLKNYSNHAQGCLSIEPLPDSSIRVGPEALVTGSAEFANGRVYYIDRLLWEPYEDPKTCKE